MESRVALKSLETFIYHVSITYFRKLNANSFRETIPFFLTKWMKRSEIKHSISSFPKVWKIINNKQRFARKIFFPLSSRIREVINDRDKRCIRISIASDSNRIKNSFLPFFFFFLLVPHWIGNWKRCLLPSNFAKRIYIYKFITSCCE